jgi:hypothetical protein
LPHEQDQAERERRHERDTQEDLQHEGGEPRRRRFIPCVSMCTHVEVIALPTVDTNQS